MSKLWDLLFHSHRAKSVDVARVQRVMIADRRSENAALKALEIQMKVAQAIGPRVGGNHGR